MRLDRVILTLSLLPVPSLADPLPGVRFDLMPVGCRIYGTYSTGEKIVDVYTGRVAGTYVMKTVSDPSGAPIRTTTHDRNGYMIRKDWASGKWETFAPYSCFQTPGPCTYHYQNADNIRKTFKGVVVQSGDGIVSSGGFVGEAPFSDTRITPGPWNLGERFEDGSVSFGVTRYENCSTATPSS